MDCRNSGIPVRIVGDEIVPESRGRKARRHYNGSTGEKRCQETCQQSMDMEERHNQQSPVLKRQFIRSLDVFCII